MAHKLVDSYREKGARKKLVELLRERGIADENVLSAIGKVPRHYFFDETFWKQAYKDIAFPIGDGQTISQPYTVAYQTELLHIKTGDKVLEIGTGSGYQTCILVELGAQVYTIERQENLYNRTKQVLPHMGYMAEFFYGDGFEGLPTYGPFDKILITAAAPFIPPKLVEQLKVGGYMVLPVDEGDNQRMLRITKKTDGSVIHEQFEEFSFVPMLTGRNA
jgi:protein-L-isoaspartate(D-aspartate) O-methyltransferase